jgi:hypothetical protein
LGSFSARLQFLKSVQSCAPKAIRALRELMVVEKPDLEKHVVAWANAHHLLGSGRVPRWIKMAALSRLDQWHFHPDVKGWNLAAVDFSVLPENETSVRIDTSWDPTSEPRPAATQRICAALAKRLDEIEVRVISKGGVKVPAKREGQHFDWAARFQVGEEDVPTIVGTQLNERVVRLGIRDVLQRIGIDHRTVRPGPKSRQLGIFPATS